MSNMGGASGKLLTAIASTASRWIRKVSEGFMGIRDQKGNGQPWPDSTRGRKTLDKLLEAQGVDVQAVLH